MCLKTSNNEINKIKNIRSNFDINQIYISDLMDELKISQDSLTAPSLETIESLELFAQQESKKHREEGVPKVLNVSNPDDWSEISKTSLYRSRQESRCIG